MGNTSLSSGKIHFIAIGGSAMHNMAIALHKKGFTVTGSDDEIFEPSLSRLKAHGLLPENWGWDPKKITSDIESIILGMHAREDNPELVRARELGLRIYSYPEYIYEQTRNKTRVVIGGSHGKTTTTSMVMHVLSHHNIDFDYMVGAQLEGFDTMVKLTHEAPIAILEGDEYLASPIDRRPKFHLYHPHIALLTGIAWDHINVFPTFDNYLEQFRIFAQKIEPQGTLIYFKGDPLLEDIAEHCPNNIQTISYQAHPHIMKGHSTFILNKEEQVPLSIFGEHNLQNLMGARLICQKLGINDTQFFQAIKTFCGASKRLQKLEEKDQTTVFMDFAHSPSKLKATTKAMKAQYTDRKLVACMELHTFSSLKKEFLPHYHNAMNEADQAFVYYNPETLRHKKLPSIEPDQVAQAFGGNNLTVFTNPRELMNTLLRMKWDNANLLLMSSGNFSGIDLPQLAKEITATLRNT